MIATEQERTNVERTEPSVSGTGALSWLLQRVSGALLVVFVLAHFWALHYAVVGEQITFENVTARLQSPLFIVLDSALLAVALYHGLNGVWQVVADFGLGRGAQRTLALVLWIVGLVTLVVGINALLPLLGGEAFVPLGAG